MEIRKAIHSDLDGVARIYDAVLTAQEEGRCTIGWVRGVYPTRDTARAALERGELFVLCEGAEIFGTAIINQTQVDAYSGAPWRHDVPDGLVCALHTLVIDPEASGRGLGSRFVAFYEDYARAHGWPELRMDTNVRNAGARALYARLGYREVGIVPTVFNGIPAVDLVLLEKNLGE